MTPDTPRRTTHQSCPGVRLRRLSQPSIHLPFSSYLSGMKTGSAGSISRALSAKKSSGAWTTSAPSRGWARLTYCWRSSSNMSGRVRVRGAPVASDLDAPAEPDVLVGERMLQEPLEPGELARPPGEPAVEPDRHHLRPLLAFRVKHIERVAQIVEELVAGLHVGAG